MVRTKNDTIVAGVGVAVAAIVVDVIFTSAKAYLENQLQSLRQSKNLIKMLPLTHVL